MKRFMSIILMVVSLPVLVHGAVLSTSAYVPETVNGWSETVQIVPFNPLLGELQVIHFTVVGEFSAQIRHENLNVVGCSYDDTISWGLEISMDRVEQDDRIIAFDDQIRVRGSLEAFDGNADYSGDSGVIHYVGTPITGGLQITGAAMEDFIGTHVMDLQIESVGEAQLYMTDPSGISLALTECTTTVLVDYEFLPAAVSGEQSSWSAIKASFR